MTPSDHAERARARSAYNAAPTTPCTADEVAFALGMPLELVEPAKPGSAYHVAGTRWAPWRSWLAALGHRVDLEAPNRAPVEPALTTWVAIAEAVGVCDETIRRARLKHAPKQRAYFESVAAAREWYAGLGAAKPRAAPVRAPAPRELPPDVPWTAAAERERSKK